VKFAWIAAEKADYPLTVLCRCLGVSPSGFYARWERPDSARQVTDRQLRVLIRASFEQSRSRYLSPRIHADLVDRGVAVSRKRVVRLMRDMGLKARVRKRFKCTTMSDHDQPVAANVLNQDFTADAPNHLRLVGALIQEESPRGNVAPGIDPGDDADGNTKPNPEAPTDPSTEGP